LKGCSSSFILSREVSRGMSLNAQFGGAGAGDAPARRAAVPSRVRILPGTASLPIERQVKSLLDRRIRGPVRLLGPPGSGKSTALAHLAATLEPGLPVAIFDSENNHVGSGAGEGEAPAEPILSVAEDRGSAGASPSRAGIPGLFQTHLVIYTSSAPAEVPRENTLELSPWTDEDLIEYLLATHPGRVRAVMSKIRSDPQATSLNGLPELWRIVLDEMAADDGVASVDDALACHLARELSDVRDRDAAERACLFALAPWGITRPTVGYALAQRIARVVRHETVRVMLGAQRLVDGLRDRTVWDELAGALPVGLIERSGKLAARCPAAIQNLDQMTAVTDDQVHAMAASILHAAGGGWRPVRQRKINLCGARLAGAVWAGIDLSGSLLARADLYAAQLSQADLSNTDLSYANLSYAVLLQATLAGAILRQAKIRYANLDGARLFNTTLAGADFTGATLEGAWLCRAKLALAIFSGANLECADLSGADLRGANVDTANFSDAKFDGADITRLDLRSATISGASFKSADLTDCNFEGLEGPADFSEAVLKSALLTGSVMPGSSFRGAVLRGCGLADIDWDGADMRDADLRGATFHMGSTRSGLVGSDIPGEGSRTGFYTDDFQDREFKDPREVRKASLCNADLRGAHVEGVDFYLVDLRGAKYSPGQADWFARCGAITCGE
jgi:uncharacterized protein YjbI with pentapeptide repeats